MLQMRSLIKNPYLKMHLFVLQFVVLGSYLALVHWDLRIVCDETVEANYLHLPMVLEFTFFPLGWQAQLRVCSTNVTSSWNHQIVWVFRNWLKMFTGKRTSGPNFLTLCSIMQKNILAHWLIAIVELLAVPSPKILTRNFPLSIAQISYVFLPQFFCQINAGKMASGFSL